MRYLSRMIRFRFKAEGESTGSFPIALSILFHTNALLLERLEDLRAVLLSNPSS